MNYYIDLRYNFLFISLLDIDECSAGNSSSQCDINANCINAYGSYGCKCKPGFSGDGRYCYGNVCKDAVFLFILQNLNIFQSIYDKRYVT